MDLVSLRLRVPRTPVAVQFTREGLIFIFLCLAIGIAAVNTGNNVLYFIFSLMLGVIIVSGMISRRMLMALTVSVDFPQHIFAGAASTCYLSISNRKKRLPSLGIAVAAGDNSFPEINSHFFHIPPASSSYKFAPVTFPHRGVFQLNEVELKTEVPFSFLIKIRRLPVSVRLTVYPRVYRLAEELLARYTEGALTASPFKGDSQQLLHLRDYTHLDSSKRIHWKASAKIERLLIKEFQKEQGRDLRLHYDCYPEKNDRDTHFIFESAISLLASLALHLSEKGIQATICFRDRDFTVTPGSSSLVPMLAYLAELTMSAMPRQAPHLRSENDVLSVFLRSKHVPAVMPSQGGLVRVLYLEDWMHLLREPVASL
jgi:uncharacterized protein (DUF58 family)